ncbi:hypothetical protein BH24ACT4_BH24ACT4_20130 [soil metagenome]
MESTALISLWCAWAAVTSLAICARLRRARPGQPLALASAGGPLGT